MKPLVANQVTIYCDLKSHWSLNGLEGVVWVQALAGDTVSCSWTRHLTLTVPLSTQVYKWVTTKLMR